MSVLELSGQATLKDLKFQMGGGTTFYFGQGHEAWGWSIQPSIKVGESGNSSFHVGMELAHLSSEKNTRLVNAEQDELLILFTAYWYTPSIANGHIQPFFKAGVGNNIVNFEASHPALGTLVDDYDSINLTSALGVGSEFLINEHFGFSLGYQFLSTFDVTIESTSDNLYQHGIQLGALVAF